MKHTASILLSFALVSSGVVSAVETRTFPASPDWLSWLSVDYPARFEMDPKSIQREAKWWAKFNDPDSKFSFEIGAFGYVNDLDLLVTIPGITYQNYFEKLPDDVSTEKLIAAQAKHKNIVDYFHAKILPAGCEKSKFPGYERFIHKKKNQVVVYFLDTGAYQKTFGRCYQTLTFTFQEGSYKMHKKDIDAMIKSAKPPYRKRSEQNGSAQSATASELKSERVEKFGPESKGRSQ